MTSYDCRRLDRTRDRAIQFSAMCLALQGFATASELSECSGIVRQNMNLIIVGDESPGTAYIYKLPDDLRPRTGPLLHQFSIDSDVHREVGGALAIDLESVEVLPNGKIVAISERLHALVGDSRILVEYPDLMGEIGGKGLEGLAISLSGKVAALWEGGYFEPNKLPPAAGCSWTCPMKPLLCIHELPSGTGVIRPNNADVVALNVPSPPDLTQSFRAPDLVWASEDELIVLLSSTDAANKEFRFKWLQRFTSKGHPIGQPLNLCAKGYLPQGLRNGRYSNFEGLAWFEEGESLVLINDHDDPTRPATAVVLDITPWPSTDPSIACDQAP